MVSIRYSPKLGILLARMAHAPHGHGAPGTGSSHSSLQRSLLISLSIAGIITVLEVVGGVLSNSLALLADAGHVGTDVLALALAAFAMKFATRPHTTTSTYGFHRSEVLAALINGVTLFVITGYIAYEAYGRFFSPPEVRGPLLLAVATIGLAANLVMVFILKKGSEVSINVRGAFLHVVGDTLSSVGVIVGGVAIITAGFFLADVLVAVLIAGLVLRSAFILVKDSVRILLEQTPRGVDVTKMSEEMMKVEGVKSVHELHVWSLTSGMNMMSCHANVDEHHRDHEVLEALNQVARRFNITHTTIQVEHHSGVQEPVNLDLKKKMEKESKAEKPEEAADPNK